MFSGGLKKMIKSKKLNLGYVALVVASLSCIYTSYNARRQSAQIYDETIRMCNEETGIGSILAERCSVQTRVDSLLSTGKEGDFEKAVDSAKNWKVVAKRKLEGMWNNP